MPFNITEKLCNLHDNRISVCVCVDVLVQIVCGMYVHMFVEVKVDVWHLLDHFVPYILRQGLSLEPRVS